MFLWNRTNHFWRAATLAATAAATFTPAEIAHLRVLRQQYETKGECWELGVDMRRRRLARWLVEQGRLGEGVDGA
jgi:hypothetical protein